MNTGIIFDILLCGCANGLNARSVSVQTEYLHVKSSADILHADAPCFDPFARPHSDIMLVGKVQLGIINNSSVAVETQPGPDWPKGRGGHLPEGPLKNFNIGLEGKLNCAARRGRSCAVILPGGHRHPSPGNSALCRCKMKELQITNQLIAKLLLNHKKKPVQQLKLHC